jgi:hypothetical protein
MNDSLRQQHPRVFAMSDYALRLAITVAFATIALSSLTNSFPKDTNASFTPRIPVADVFAADSQRTVFVRYWLVTKNGGPNGFNYNEEISEELDGVYEHRLVCLEPGFQSAKFDESIPPYSEHPPRLIDVAREQIAQGVLRGERELVHDGVLHRVTWSAQDALNVEIEETLAR